MKLTKKRINVVYDAVSRHQCWMYQSFNQCEMDICDVIQNSITVYGPLNHNNLIKPKALKGWLKSHPTAHLCFAIELEWQSADRGESEMSISSILAAICMCLEQVVNPSTLEDKVVADLNSRFYQFMQHFAGPKSSSMTEKEINGMLDLVAQVYNQY